MLKVVDVRFAWDEALPMIDSIRVSSGSDWRCEDVYASCLSGDSTMLMPDETNSGVIVLSTEINKFTLQKFLFVWICFSKENDAQQKYIEPLEEIARQEGCVYIEMQSHRIGFMKSKDWKPCVTTYRKEV